MYITMDQKQIEKEQIENVRIEKARNRRIKRLFDLSSIDRRIFDAPIEKNTRIGSMIKSYTPQFRMWQPWHEIDEKSHLIDEIRRLILTGELSIHDIMDLADEIKKFTYKSCRRCGDSGPIETFPPNRNLCGECCKTISRLRYRMKKQDEKFSKMSSDERDDAYYHDYHLELYPLELHGPW